MNPLEQGTSSRPDLDQFNRDIPRLVTLACRMGKESRRPREELTAGLISSPSYDPMLVVFEQMQRILLEKRSPKEMKLVAEFFGTLLNTVNKDIIENGPKPLYVNPATISSAQKIDENDKRIQQDGYARKLLQTFLPINYANMLLFAKNAQDSEKRGKPAIDIQFLSSAGSVEARSERTEEEKAFNTWLDSMEALMPTIERPLFDPERKDEFVTQLRAEPLTTNIGRERLFTRRFAEISIRDMQQFPYPPSEDDLDKVTNYLTALFSSRINMSDSLYIQYLFFEPILFFDTTTNERIIYKNHALLALIAVWHERFTDQLVHEQNPEREKQLQTVLNGVDQVAAYYILCNALEATAYPLEYDPEFKGDNKDERISFYPLLDEAIFQYQQDHPEEPFVYVNQIGIAYFGTTVLPLIEKRLKQLGLGGKFKEAIVDIRERTRELFSEVHMATLKEFFEKNCGLEFIDRLNSRSDDIRDIASTVWQATAVDMHFLPMQEGINIVEFSKESVPEILGLESIGINTSGQVEQWKVNICFQFHNTFTAVIGTIDDEGKLQLKIPLEREIPGLYTMLNHIAVLVFHDLVIQKKKEQEGGTRGDGRKNKGEKRQESQRARSHDASLPRVQTDEKLISDVYAKTGFTPRRVELHKTYLRGTKEYEKAVEMYREAVKTNSSETTLVYLQKQLIQARGHSHQPSEQKKRSIPARFQLKTVIDPITGDERHLETWVIEHTSPNPTPEQLKSPRELFLRYYSHASALAYLEQMMPWFVGQ